MKRPKICFLRESDGTYTEITYDDLLRLEIQDASYRSRFFLCLDECLMEVTKENWRGFKKAERRNRYLLEEAQRVGGVLSLDSETSAENPLYEILADASVHVEQAAESSLLLEHLREALSNLLEEDRALIQALYFRGKTERECAASQGLSPSTIHEQKVKILLKLKKLMEN